MPWRSMTPLSRRSRLSQNGPAGRSRSPAMTRTLATAASARARRRKSLACVKLARRRAARCGTGTNPARASLRQALILDLRDMDCRVPGGEQG
ncbi:MAG: hypothetical protein ACREFK_16350 [Stellaceae bacterium]